MSITMPLTSPIEAHGETIRQLTLREPKGRDLRTCGSIHILPSDDKSGFKVDYASIARLIAALANIPPSSVDLMSAYDFSQASGVVVGFFRPPVVTDAADTSG